MHTWTYGANVFILDFDSHIKGILYTRLISHWFFSVLVFVFCLFLFANGFAPSLNSLRHSCMIYALADQHSNLNNIFWICLVLDRRSKFPKVAKIKREQIFSCIQHTFGCLLICKCLYIISFCRPGLKWKCG